MIIQYYCTGIITDSSWIITMIPDLNISLLTNFPTSKFLDFELFQLSIFLGVQPSLMIYDPQWSIIFNDAEGFLLFLDYNHDFGLKLFPA